MTTAGASPGLECWLRPDVVVARSDIAGRGLFATAPIATGTAVSSFGGRLRTTAESQRLIADQAAGYVEAITVGDDVHLVLAPGSPNRFGNHSCEPNLWWERGYTLAARRDIAAGEELTYDYSTSIADPQFLLRCHCGSSRCRQMVTGDDWRIRELQTAYAGHWVPALQRLVDAQRSAGRQTPQGS